jgi:hypothetical protein
MMLLAQWRRTCHNRVDNPLPTPVAQCVRTELDGAFISNRKGRVTLSVELNRLVAAASECGRAGLIVGQSAQAEDEVGQDYLRPS